MDGWRGHAARTSGLICAVVAALLLAPAASTSARASETPVPEPAGLAQVSATAGLAQVSALSWPAPAVDVLAGGDRIGTGVAVSRAGWPGTAPAAVLASAADYPDALAAAALAGVVGGPVLLTWPDALDPRTAEELRRLDPATVHVIGGWRAVRAAVLDAVAALGPTVERIAGADRYATASAVADRVVELGGNASRVLVASGEAFPDALAASSLAAAFGHPVLLVSARTDPAALAARVAELGGEEVWVVGGTAAVPDAPLQALPGYERLAGGDRAGTAAVVARRARALGLDGRPVIASGEAFPDGLTGGAFAGAARRAPMLLTARAELSEGLMGWLAEDRPPAVTRLGGPAAVGPLASCQLGSGTARPWRCVEEELARQGYNTGAVDGQVDHQSAWTVFALQKVAGLAVTGRFEEAEWRALVRRPTIPARRPDLGPDHLEVDLARQLLLVYRAGEMAHALHVSSGKPSTPTVLGTFTVFRKLDYGNVSDMYWPIYFYPRYAIHGYPEVPLYPASHGCVRVYDGDQDFLWPKVPLGERIAIYR